MNKYDCKKNLKSSGPAKQFIPAKADLGGIALSLDEKDDEYIRF